MELINWIITGLLTSLLCFQWIKIRQLDKLVAHQQAHISDLAFRHSEASEFLENQIAKIHYQFLIRSDRLMFNEDTPLSQAIAHSGARDILVKSRLIKKKDEVGKDETLGNRARNLNIPLDPVLAKLNMLEVSQ